MKVLILTDEKSWINPHVADWSKLLEGRYEINFSHNHLDEQYSREITLILSYSKIIKQNDLDLSKHNLVVHESDLPKGKGMSPLTWQVLEGAHSIPICLFEAHESLDSGNIYFKDVIELEGHELVDELRVKQGKKTFELIERFLEKYPEIEGVAQSGESTFYKRRGPADSELDVNKTIEEQFNLLRVCDNQKYPAFFRSHGQKYKIMIEKMIDE